MNLAILLVSQISFEYISYKFRNGNSIKYTKIYIEKDAINMNSFNSNILCQKYKALHFKLTVK